MKKGMLKIDMNSQEIKILKQTKSVCPECLKELDALIIKTNNKIILKRECLVHGGTQTVISNAPEEFEELFNYYNELDSLHNKKRKKNQNTVFYTNRCNIDCPICFMNANFKEAIPDPSIDTLKNFLKTVKKAKINIFGGEPTIREDLSEFIASIKDSGNLSALFTNGIKISDFSYLKTLKDAGLDELHLQFDGFKEETDLKFRNVKLLKNKLKALENARILNIPVIFEVTLDREVNFNDIADILGYALDDRHIRGVCFRSYCALGKRGVGIDKLTIDDLVSGVEKNSKGRIRKDDVFILQKLVYIMAEWLNLNWCFSHRYMLIYRNKDKNYFGLGEIFSFKKIARPLNHYLKLRKINTLFARLYFIFVIIPIMINLKNTRIFLHLLRVVILSKSYHALTQSSFGNSFLVIDFESPCDRFTFDLGKVCNTDVIGEDMKVYPSFYAASLAKERFFQEFVENK